MPPPCLAAILIGLTAWPPAVDPQRVVPLQTVEPKRLYRQIAEQLRSLIAGGEFQAGSRLPAERDLASQLGVSRPSVREALIALEVEGWVEVRTGSGVYVLPRNGASAHGAQVPASEWGPLELLRARRVIEGEIAALAASQARARAAPCSSTWTRPIPGSARAGAAPILPDPGKFNPQVHPPPSPG